MKPTIRIEELRFSSKNNEKSAALNFSNPFTFVYGASNTGKSFAVKAIDFMLGGGRELPDISERKPYSRVELDLRLPNDEIAQLMRAIVGGDYRLNIGIEAQRTLSARHNKDSDDNLSNYLLTVLGISGQEIARDKSGTKKPLSFRDIARLCITDETSIQSETSPALSGDVSLATLEKNIFKFMLTGEDDSALVTHTKPKDFATGRNAQVRMIDEMILELETEIADDYPDLDQLDSKLDEIEGELDRAEREIAFARDSVRSKLERKKELVVEIGRDQQRLNDIVITLENFEQLMKVYGSDIERLEALEEAGFLLGLNIDTTCPVCGAPPEAQAHKHALVEIEAARAAAEIEIAKIRAHQNELKLTISNTSDELERTENRLILSRGELKELEIDLSTALPETDDNLRKLSEIIPKRDRIKRGLALVMRRDNLTKQRNEVAKRRQTKSVTNAQMGLSTHTVQEFAAEVGDVLRAWGFPGDCTTFFDLDGTFDLIIDGKQRRNNGKGVRAITHAAFKIALLIFCRKRKLPHPGFIILDTPLITYRDPIRSRAGALSEDEKAIRNSDLKEKMFEHLASISSAGQFILFDNADPPEKASIYTTLQTFTNDPTVGRQGLL
ncbi:MAG: hypothetical protein P1U72_06320 [Paracoccaceae bacterium]|nr:hypothetical protein [Paracoccaceae bacterium]